MAPPKTIPHPEVSAEIAALRAASDARLAKRAKATYKNKKGVIVPAAGAVQAAKTLASIAAQRKKYGLT
jgi:hypothetical protein